MDPPGSYNSHHRQQLFPQGQLPPPSQLHLAFNRSNTLPPIPNIPSDSRYPPPSYHPSLSTPTASSPGGSTWPSHRTSSSRDESVPQRRRDQKSKQLESPTQKEHPVQSSSSHDQVKDSEDGMASTSDFVKKLYKMLEDTSFTRVVSWNSTGDAFVVKDMNEFTKSILPRMFKHSNFASFVRQLNKYDFHKVKNADDNQYGEHSWTFRHPDFQADRRDALENIKRKVPAQRKAPAVPPRAVGRNSPSNSESAESGVIQTLQGQIDRLVQNQEDMSSHIRRLENNYQNVLGEMVNFQKTMAQQDGLLQNLIHYFLQMENSKIKQEPSSGSFTTDHNPFVPAIEAQRMVGSYPETDVARASLEQLNEISRRANAAGMSFSNPDPAAAPSIFAAAAGIAQRQHQFASPPLSREDALQRIEEITRTRSAAPPPIVQHDQQQGSSTQLSDPNQFDDDSEPSVLPGIDGTVEQYTSHPGLQVFTLGHLMPKSGGDDDSAIWSFDPLTYSLPTAPDSQPEAGPSSASYTLHESATNAGIDSSPDNPDFEGPISRPGSAQKLRVRRSTFVPGWAVPPRVLLVDDDAVNRKLSTKFLQVFGCTIDIAVDGAVAVDKMNLAKYDLVLMDIVMPKLDGVTATTLIRQFDHMTPIISMTSSSSPDEIVTYYNHGMNDILPKPFTKEGLLSMLEKHLNHLKVIKEMSRVPRSLGIPPLSDSSFDQALVISANAPAPRDEDGRVNPLAGMGLSDETYAAILQRLLDGESFPLQNGSTMEKRRLDDHDDDRNGKRGRFEEIE